MNNKARLYTKGRNGNMNKADRANVARLARLTFTRITYIVSEDKPYYTELILLNSIN